MRRAMWVLGICTVVAGAQAAGPKPAFGAELGGWGPPGPADRAVLEELESENLAEAGKSGRLKIEATKRDLDGDGIAELFFFLQHPLFCFEEGCTILVVHRASLSDAWREIGVLTTPSTRLLVMPAQSGELPVLRPLGSQPYAWDGRQYRLAPDGAPASGEGR